MKMPSSVLGRGLVILLVILKSLSATAATLGVPVQFSTIQAAIDAAATGDTILVASGTYQESLDLTGKTVTLRSQSGAANTTIIGRTGHVLTFNGNDRSTVVSGFTIQNPPNSTESVYASNASPTLTDNRFIYSDGSMIAVWASESSLVLERNLFYGWKIGGSFNSAVSLSSVVAPVVRDNVFYNNGGGLYIDVTNLSGGTTPKADVANNTFAGNAGSIQIESARDASLLSFRNNIVLGGQTGVYFASGTGAPIFQNNLVYSTRNYVGLPDPTGTNGNISSDPRLSGLTALDFQPDAGSPAIDAGLNAAVGAGDTDFNQAQRILVGSSGKALVDIGAVEYVGAPPTVSLQVSSNTVLLGATVTIAWSSSNATGCSAGGAWSGALALSGTRTITPPSGTTNYTVTCSNAIATRQQSTVLTVYPPPVAHVTLSPMTVYQGQTFTSAWSSTNASACTGSGAWAGPLGTAGSTQSHFADGGTYTFGLTCTGPGGTASASAKLTVISGPTITFESTDLPLNASTRITWTAFPGATACVASGSWSGAVATSGTKTVGPFAAGAYPFNLTCSAPGISAATTRSLSVYGPAAPEYEALSIGGTNSGQISAFASPGTAPTSGGLDGKGYAYNSAALVLGPALGQTFEYSPTGVSNQTIPLINGPISSLTILATGVNGSQPGQTFTVGYSDGSISNYTQSLSDWHYPQNYSGETIAASMASRITATAAVQAGTFNIYAYRIPVDSTRFATSLKLPLNRNVVVLAMNGTLAPQGTIHDISSAVNVEGVATAGHPAAGGGLDGIGYALDSALTSSGITYSGQLYGVMSAGQSDVASGSTIPLLSVHAQTLTILAVGVNGNQANQPFVINYDDGSSTTFRQNLSDWHTSQRFAGEAVALTMKDRVTSSGALQLGAWNIYAYTFQTDANRILTSLSLPKNRNVIVLAVDSLGH